MKLFLKKHFPIESIIPLLFILLFQCVCYLIPKFFIAQGWYFKIFDFKTQFDISTPLIPEFIVIYFGCFAFWAFSIFVLFRTNDKKRCYDIVLSVVTCHIICMIIYILLPTTTNIRPDMTQYNGNNIFKIFLKLCYSSDTPYNLFPSMHCTVSWFCYLAVRKRKEISLSYRIFAFVFCLLIFASILFTKQHYVWDILPSILLCEIVYYIVRKTQISYWFKDKCMHINKLLKIDKYINNEKEKIHS